ncbi:hypothetical protein, partial [Streptomyces telluris]
YAWITAVDAPETRELQRTPLPAAHAPATHTYEFTAPQEGEAWVGLRKTGDGTTAEFVLDGFTVYEAGGTDGAHGTAERAAGGTAGGTADGAAEGTAAPW